jgi:hypothetical protein
MCTHPGSGRRALGRGEPVPMDEFGRCSVCLRNPLIGERITVMRDGQREAAVCDFCLQSPRAKVLGEAVRRERVRSAAGAANVKRARPAPALQPQRPEPAPVG